MRKHTGIVILLMLLINGLSGQSASFEIMLEPLTIDGLGGLQSYAYGQHDGKWLLVGGRLDGLHQRQPFAAFDIAGHNTQLIVIDPVNLLKWQAPLTSLPLAVQEQLKSTNMQFYQSGDYLYLTGGYGYSTTANDHTTYPHLLAMDIPATIQAVINNTSLVSHIRQISDPLFQVTGGRLEKIGELYYLVGGQKFIGRYNPMGPDMGPGFIQEYTNQIRKFTIEDDGLNLSFTHIESITDTVNLHRRDYNVSPQIFPSGEEGLTAFSGVFQYEANMPYIDCVNITSSNYEVPVNFSQYYNHYHCPHIPIYSANRNEMNTVFFGGIALYYDSLGTLVQNNDVPFVKTIARVSRDASGVMSEHKLPIEMPSYLGAGSEFITLQDIAQYDNHVIKYDELTSDTTLVGHIFGGISSSAQNIFFVNDGSQSSASNILFKVYLVKSQLSATHQLNGQSVSSLKLIVYPNPDYGNFLVKYFLVQPTDVTLSLYTINGTKIFDRLETNQSAGSHIFESEVIEKLNPGTYIVTLSTTYEQAVQKIIVPE